MLVAGATTPDKLAAIRKIVGDMTLLVPGIGAQGGKVEDVIPALQAWEIPGIEKQAGHFPHFEDEILRKTGEPIVIDTPSIENSYYAVCALGLKQLGKHARAIGFLNKDGQFDGLLQGIQNAARERFITEKCLMLFDAAASRYSAASASVPAKGTTCTTK